MEDGARAVVAVVDDQSSVRSSLARLLRSADYIPTKYPSGQEFLDSLNSAPPDCVILDLRMPGLNGFEVLARLALREPRVPVVVLTSYPSAEAKERAVAEGVAAFLTKPVDRIVLLEAVQRAVEASDR
jgi:FixJ family two-component response regulator